jgi:hypothetical protein
MENPLCKYKDLIGRPGEGIHSYRLFGIAIVDFFVTLLAALLCAYYFKWNVWYTLIGFFAAGILAHKAFCVRTAFDKMLFG